MLYQKNSIIPALALLTSLPVLPILPSLLLSLHEILSVPGRGAQAGLVEIHSVLWEYNNFTIYLMAT